MASKSSLLLYSKLNLTIFKLILFIVNTDSEMGVNTNVSSGSSNIFTLLIRNVESCSLIPELLAQTKINHIYHVSFFSQTNQEILWFQITEYKIIIVKVLNSRKLFVFNI